MVSNRTWSLLVALFLAASTGRAAAGERQIVRRQMPDAAERAQSVSRPGAEQRLNFVLVLPLRNQAALTNLLAEIYDPASPRFRQFLTPEQFTAMFGPSEKDYQAVLDYAQAQGFEVSHKHSNRTMISVGASVAHIERAFGVTMRTYRHPSENRLFRAPDTDLALDVAVPVLAVDGLDDFSLPRPLSRRRPPLPATAPVTPQTGTAPYGAYMGADFRAAYAPGVTLTGAGQTVGLLQFDGYDPADIAAYKVLASLPDVLVTNVLLDGFSGTPGDYNNEVCLDIEMAISMAPGLDKVVVYEAGLYGNANDILNRMAQDNTVRQFGSSWTWTRSSSADQIYQQMAAQGQSFFQASGDNDAYTSSTVSNPSDNPYITVVGGTTLTMSGAGGAWSSETVWNWGYYNGAYRGSGGGYSTNYAIPAWQQGISMTSNRGSTIWRNLPDVAMTADNVYVLYGSGTNGVFGGTSCATPLWAGFCALINQQAAINAMPPVGFINPAIYSIGKGPAYTALFHDITTGNNRRSGSTNFYAVAGYDLCTGWGTPTGQSLIDVLASTNVPVILTLTVQSSNGGASPGSTNVLAGTVLYERIINSPAVSGATQYVCAGATATGNVFTQTSPTNVTLTLTNNATLTWNWQARYLLTTATNGPGSVTGGGWYVAGSNAAMTATPATNATFQKWSGDTNGCEIAGNTLTAPMTQARAITAVFALNTRTLTVVSSQGGTLPGAAVANTGTVISAWVTNSPVMNGTTQYICTGGTVSGNDYVQASPTNVILTLTNNATLTWSWRTLYLLAAATNGPGSVTPGDWYAAGGNQVLTATPAANAFFTGWRGDTNGCEIEGNTLTAPMTQARTITAAFAFDIWTLTVVSPQGEPIPGTVTVDGNAPVSEWIANSPEVNGATQYVCVGATVVGNDFIQISPTNATVTLTNNAVLTWNWTTNYWLVAGTNGAGTVSVTSGWQRAGSNVAVIATPAPTSHFVQWSGDTNGCLAAFTTLTVPITRPRAITAVFAAGATPVISGKVTKTGTTNGVAGVTIAFSGGAGIVTTGSSGTYSNTVPYKWSGTATASCTNGGFATSNLTYSALTANKTAQNYVWTPPPVISGKITKTGSTTGVAGMQLLFSGAGGTVATDSGGNYSNIVAYGWSGTVTPSTNGIGGVFSPANKTYSKLTASKTAQNFTWTAPAAGIASQTVSGRTTLPATNGFALWALQQGLAGNPADLFAQIAGGDGITYGAEYAFGANLAMGEPILRLLEFNGVLTAEAPLQDPATLIDVLETVEFTCDKGSGIWFPAVFLPSLAPTPPTKQWFQAGYGAGAAVDFRMTVQLVK